MYRLMCTDCDVVLCEGDRDTVNSIYSILQRTGHMLHNVSITLVYIPESPSLDGGRLAQYDSPYDGPV